MGGSSSKVEIPETETSFDFSKLATVPLEAAQDMGRHAEEALGEVNAAAEKLQAQNTWLTSVLYWIVILIVVTGVCTLLYYYAWPPLKNLIWPPAAPTPTSVTTPVTSTPPPVKAPPPTQPGSNLKNGQVSEVVSSSGGSASYGYQFWLFITDWNYKFGKDKAIFSRNDPSKSIQNPSVMLHPTDNSLKISVSVYPNENTSKNDPAPAGHSGATDDVFLCEVSNIPIQKWVSVSISVDSRNLDVYLDGNLVKSCLLTGVPKPAMGDVVLNDKGGFSGWLCGFNSYSKALVPSDIQIFNVGGVPCSIPDDTAYSTKFGFFNSSGKEVSKYVF
jgi:hypothetical protein